jgi:iron(II)-dependent oxidoreductase
LTGKVRIVSISSALLGVSALALAAGAALADEPVAGNPLIEIPPGSFVFGNDNGIENERPSRVIAGKGFAMNRTEISNAKYKRFVEATGHRPAFYANHPLLGFDDHPVVGVSWDDAAAFCAHYGLNLPSEQEYERAARGTNGMPFPWGTAPLSATRVNGGSPTCCGADDSDGYAMTAPVDSFALGASPQGILNLIGNVWEWTRDLYAPYEGEADAETAGKYRVLRGGAWNSDPGHLTTTYRLAYAPDFRFAANGGFRCVRSP